LPWFKPFCGRHEKMLPSTIIARLKSPDGRYRVDWDWQAITEAKAIISDLENPN